MSPFDYFRDRPRAALIVAGLLTLGAGLGIEAARWLILAPATIEEDAIAQFPKRPKLRRPLKPISFDRMMGLLTRAQEAQPAEAKKFVEEFKKSPELQEAWGEVQETQDVEKFVKKLEKLPGFGAIASSARYGSLASALLNDAKEGEAAASTGFFGLGGGKRTVPGVLLAGAGPARKVSVETPGGPVFADAPNGRAKGGAASISGGGSAGGVGPGEGAANNFADRGETRTGGGAGTGVPSPTPSPEPPPTDHGPGPDPSPPPGPDPDPRTPPDPPSPRDRPGSDPKPPGSGFEMPDLGGLMKALGGEGGQPGGGMSGTSAGAKNEEPKMPSRPDRASAAKYLGDYARYFAGEAVRKDLRIMNNAGSDRIESMISGVQRVAPQRVATIEQQPDRVRFLKQERSLLITDDKQASSMAGRLKQYRRDP